jgi:hypothetical protein
MIVRRKELLLEVTAVVPRDMREIKYRPLPTRWEGKEIEVFFSLKSEETYILLGGGGRGQTEEIESITY